MTHAGNALHMTQSAVSKQIKNLEEQLGRKLFERYEGQLTLTPVGEQFAEEVRFILERLAQVTDKVALRDTGAIRYNLKVITEPTVALHWLAPKLREFYTLYPEIEVDLNTDFVTADRNIRRCDLAILFGDGHWVDGRADYLRPERLVAVSAPQLMMGRTAKDDMSGVLELPFLHHENPISTTTMWLKAIGKSDKEIAQFKGSHYETLMLLYEVVKGGLGASILPRYLVEKDLKEGTLVKVCTEELIPKQKYYLVSQDDRQNEYPVRSFRRWVLSHREE